ncbi:MAG: methyltransferase domain-containing protein [Verrucomicrobiota bacterium]
MSFLTYWKIDECSAYYDRLQLSGWCHVPGEKIVSVDARFRDGYVCRLQSFGIASPDVDAYCGPGAAHVRFSEWLSLPTDVAGTPFELLCWLEDGRCVIGQDALTNAAWGDAYYQSWENFIVHLGNIPSGAVLEIGSRARSAITRSHRIPKHLEYVGLDIMAGPNVDIVGDAHELSRVLGERRFVAAFSTSVFEHLAMPWKVVLELNRILAPGALVYTASHQTFPLHEIPWDFFRFSQYSWRALFNADTGYEVLEAVVGEPARVHARRTSDVTRDLYHSPAWLGSACLARKTSDTALSWPVSLATVTQQTYPTATLSTPPTTNRT